MEVLKRVRTSLLAATALLCIGSVTTVSLTGCTGQQKQSTVQVVKQINAQVPAIISGADTVAATVEMIEPQYAALIDVSSQAFDATARTLQALTTSYLANPDAAVLTQIQTAINTLEANVNTATLNAVGIKDVESQRLALAALKGLLTVVSVVFGLISQTETKAQLLRLRETGTIHLARVRPFMDERELQSAALASGIDVNTAFRQAAAFGF